MMHQDTEPAPDSLERLRAAARGMIFSRRRYLFSELQRRVSGSNSLRDGTVVAWPDVLLFLTPAIVDESIAAAENATRLQIEARLRTMAGRN